MILSDKQLAEIEQLAGLFLTWDEIAILLDIPFDALHDMMADKNSAAYKHYFRGKTISKKNIRENVVKMARHGSPQAEELVEAYIIHQKQYEKRNHGR